MNIISKELENYFTKLVMFSLPEDGGIFPAKAEISGEANVTLIAGPNASGKSLVSKMIANFSREQNLPCRVCSMLNRSQGGIESAMIFGDESYNSTGVNSLSAIENSLKSTVNDKKGVVILDEPDIGLSEEYSGGLGKYVADFMNDKGLNFTHLVIVSHSRLFFNCFIEGYRKEINKVYMSKRKTFDDWRLGAVEVASVEDLKSLYKNSRDKFLAINELAK